MDKAKELAEIVLKYIALGDKFAENTDDDKVKFDYESTWEEMVDLATKIAKE